jgi:hypothetical protein
MFWKDCQMRKWKFVKLLTKTEWNEFHCWKVTEQLDESLSEVERSFSYERYEFGYQNSMFDNWADESIWKTTVNCSVECNWENR